MTAKQMSPLEATRELLDVSVTERVGFRTCRRRWWLQTIDNLAPRLPIWALEFGTGMHSALEVYYNSRSIKKAHAALDKWYKKEEKRSAENELRGLPGADELLDELFDLRTLGHGMLDNYVLYEKTATVQLGKVLAVEGKFKKGVKFKNVVPKGYPPEAAVELHPSGRLMVPIVNPDTKQPFSIQAGYGSGTGPYLTGKIDLLTERKTPKKGIWVVDHKTAASAHQEDGLEFDDQVTGYCYIVWRWTGVIPRGVVYNDLIKQLPKDPRMVKEETELSAAKDQLTTAALYKEKMKELGLITPGGLIVQEKYEDCLNALLARGYDPFFRRFELTRNEEQLLNFERRLADEYWSMIEVRKEPKGKAYPNPMVMNCRGCGVKRICLAMEDGSDAQGIIETEFHEGRDRKAVNP